MNRVLPTVIVLVIAVITQALANSFWPEPEPFHPNVRITWAATNVLPRKLMVYETVPTNFSQSVLSNAMAIGSFRPINITSKDKNLIVFEIRQDAALIRSLKISATQGSIDYFDSQIDYSSIHGVPTAEEARRLAMEYLHRMNGDTNQVKAWMKSGIMKGTVETYDKEGGRMLNKATYSRGVTFYRQLDGIQEYGSHFMIYFGNDAKVCSLNMNWRILKPVRLCKTFTPDELLDWIKSGHAVILPDINGGPSIPSQVKTLTVVKATPLYATHNADGFIYPSVDLDITANAGSTNTETFSIECLITSTNMVSASIGRNPLPQECLNVLENADEFTLLSLDPEPWLKRTNNFYGFPILGKTQIKDPKQRRKILDALYSGLSLNGSEAMCFDPRHGIHAKLGNQTEDLLICFECGQVYFHGISEGKLSVNNAPVAIFNDVLSGAHVPLLAAP